MELFVYSLKASAFVTALFGAVLCLLLPLRLYMLWRRTRLVKISMPYLDAGQARLQIWEAFKALCEPAQVAADGSMLLEPKPIRRRLGLKPVIVVFSEPNLASITGQAVVLSRLARSQRLSWVAVPGNSFGEYLKPISKYFAWGLVIVYAILFIVIYIGDPHHLSARNAVHSQSQ